MHMVREKMLKFSYPNMGSNDLFSFKNIKKIKIQKLLDKKNDLEKLSYFGRSVYNFH